MGIKPNQALRVRADPQVRVVVGDERQDAAPAKLRRDVRVRQLTAVPTNESVVSSYPDFVVGRCKNAIHLKVRQTSRNRGALIPTQPEDSGIPCTDPNFAISHWSDRQYG